jgi:phosphopantetheinyl transferase (holo-ACP synthase)
VSLGNDVVDLGDPEARLEGLHPRFAERVFTPAERGRLEASGEERPVLHWALWAAKESAYKALARLEPRTVFSPRAFEVELAGLPGDRVPATGRVRHGSRSFALEVSRRGDALQAVAWDDAAGSPGGATPRWQVAVTDGDPGAARRLAIRVLGATLRPGHRPIRIVGRPPVAVGAKGPLDLVLSLSHHGRWVAFAWATAARSRDERVAGGGGPASNLGRWR